MSNWQALTKGSDTAKKISVLQSALVAQITTFANTPLPRNVASWLNVGDIVKFWCENNKTFLNEAPHGLNLTDMLFVLLCHAHVIRKNKIEESKARSQKLNTRETAAKLQQLGMSLPDAVSGGGDLNHQQIFEDCVALVVWNVQPAAAYVQITKPRGFGMDFGNPEDEYKGDQAEQLQDMEIAKQKYSEIRSKKMEREFLPWCSRIFFQLWAVDRIKNDFKAVQSLDEQQHRRVMDARLKYDKWMEQQFKIADLPAEFYRKFSAWTMRLLTPIGAQLYLQRTPHLRDRVEQWQNLFTADDVDTKHPHETWLRKQKPADIYHDQKHVLHDLVQLVIFATLFDCTYKNTNFATDYLMFRDEIVHRRALLYEDAVNLLPRAPLLVQTGNAYEWQIHHNGRWYPAGASMRDNLLLWCILVRDDRDSHVLNGVCISDWLAALI